MKEMWFNMKLLNYGEGTSIPMLHVGIQKGIYTHSTNILFSISITEGSSAVQLNSLSG
jgi:hypothetical protein